MTGPRATTPNPQRTLMFVTTADQKAIGHEGAWYKKKQRMSGNWDTAPPGDVTFRNPGGRPGFLDA